MNIFRTATGQAIRDIITDHSVENRFGRSLTDSDLDSICERIVDLFEMTLQLRAQVSGTSDAPGESKNPPRNGMRPVRWEDEPVKALSARAAAEIFSLPAGAQSKRNDALPALAPLKSNEVDLKLPRKRISVSEEEQELLMSRARKPSAVQRPVP